MADSRPAARNTPTLATATRAWDKIGLLSFGGPAAQIDLMHKTLVDEHQWLSERHFMSALNFCMLLPGPEAMQLATYAGWRLHGTVGGLVAGLLFIVRGAAVIMTLAMLYVLFGHLPLVAGLFVGIQAAVLVIVLQALIRLSRRALRQPLHWVMAVLAFVGIFALNAPFPLIVLLAAICGSLAKAPAAEGAQSFCPVSPQGTLQTISLWLAIWLVPLGVLIWMQAPQILIDAGVFFSKLAVVTFGGAYAVLAYVAQDAVATKGWLSAREMIDVLGLAETTPGPLILVTQFVGFLAGFKEGGMLLGLGTALIVLRMTFAPCFLWIFASAPYIKRLSNMPRLQGALSAITAAVVGVILNLSIWFGVHVLFADMNKMQAGPISLLLPELASVNWTSVLLFCLCGSLLLWRRSNVPLILFVAALLGAIATIV